MRGRGGQMRMTLRQRCRTIMTAAASKVLALFILHSSFLKNYYSDIAVLQAWSSNGVPEIRSAAMQCMKNVTTLC